MEGRNRRQVTRGKRVINRSTETVRLSEAGQTLNIGLSVSTSVARRTHLHSRPSGSETIPGVSLPSGRESQRVMKTETIQTKVGEERVNFLCISPPATQFPWPLPVPSSAPLPRLTFFTSAMVLASSPTEVPPPEADKWTSSLPPKGKP